MDSSVTPVDETLGMRLEYSALEEAKPATLLWYAVSACEVPSRDGGRDGPIIGADSSVEGNGWSMAEATQRVGVDWSGV